MLAGVVLTKGGATSHRLPRNAGVRAPPASHWASPHLERNTCPGQELFLKSLPDNATLANDVLRARPGVGLARPWPSTGSVTRFCSADMLGSKSCLVSVKAFEPFCSLSRPVMYLTFITSPGTEPQRGDRLARGHRREPGLERGSPHRLPLRSPLEGPGHCRAHLGPHGHFPAPTAAAPGVVGGWGGLGRQRHRGEPW